MPNPEASVSNICLVQRNLEGDHRVSTSYLSSHCNAPSTFHGMTYTTRCLCLFFKLLVTFCCELSLGVPEIAGRLGAYATTVSFTTNEAIFILAVSVGSA